VSSEIVPTSRPVDARYTWIEAEIERYDDLRKPLALPTPVADPKPKVVEVETLPIWSLAAPAVPEPTPPISTLDETDTVVPDVLAALVAEFGGTVRAIPNTPDLLKPTQVASANPTPKKRRTKLDLTKAPDDAPTIQIVSPCPELTITPPSRIQSGLQMPLF
jgi:hypothetical protein